MNLMHDLYEMTMRAGSLEAGMKAFFDFYSNKKSEFKHVGDIEKIKVLKGEMNNSTIYVLTLDNEAIAYFVTLMNNSFTVFNGAYVVPAHRSQKLTEKFLAFLKKHENGSKILFGKTHSSATVELIKSIAKSMRYELSWVSDDGKKKEKYDEKTIDKFYSLTKPTEWSVLLENDGIFEGAQRFYNLENHDLHQFYDWWVEDMTPYV